MHNWTQAQKLQFLIDRGSPYQPGVKLSPWFLERGIKERTGGPTLTWRFLKDVLDGHKKITSLEKLELLASHFDVPVAFFSESPDQWLPPVAPALFQMAVLATDEVTPEGHAYLAELAATAVELAREHRESQDGESPAQPGQWVPPLPEQRPLQYALRAIGPLDDRSRETLDALLQKAREIADQHRREGSEPQD